MAVSLAMDHKSPGLLTPAFVSQTVRLERDDGERSVDQPLFADLVTVAHVHDAPGVTQTLDNRDSAQSDEATPNNPETTFPGPARVMPSDETAGLAPVEGHPSHGITASTVPDLTDHGPGAQSAQRTVGVPSQAPDFAGRNAQTYELEPPLSQRTEAGPASNQAAIGLHPPGRMVNTDPAQPASLPGRPVKTAQVSAVVMDEHARVSAPAGDRSVPHAEPMRLWPSARDVQTDPGVKQYTARAEIKAKPSTAQAPPFVGSIPTTPGQAVTAPRQPAPHRADVVGEAQLQTSRNGPIGPMGLAMAGGQVDATIAQRFTPSPPQTPGQPLDRGNAGPVPSAMALLRAESTRAQAIDGPPGAATGGATHTRSFLPTPNAEPDPAVLSEKFSLLLPKARVDPVKGANGPALRTISQGPAVVDSRSMTAVRDGGGAYFAAETVIAPVGDEDVTSMPSTRQDGTPPTAGVSHATPAASSQPQIWSTVGAIRQMVAENLGALADARSVDLDLATQELGRLKLSLSANEGTMFIHLQADRPDTLDLFRRHGDILARALQDIGYEGIDFSFSDGENGTARHGAGDENASIAPGPRREAIEPISVVIDVAQSSAPRGDRVDLMM